MTPSPDQLSNGIIFHPHSLTQSYKVPDFVSKPIPKDLQNVLANPEANSIVQAGANKIYLGQGAKDPKKSDRVPVYLPSDLLSSHVLIAGAIGSGKTCLLLRILAGALKTHSVVISEAKGGVDGGKEGAAFTHIAQYLQKKNPLLKTYRWPRGDCSFNPLNYLHKPQDIRIFLDAVCEQIISNSGVSGDMVAFVYNAANIAELIISFLQKFRNQCTIRKLVVRLRQPLVFKQELEKCRLHITNQLKTSPNPKLKSDLNSLGTIFSQLEMLNFFYLQDPKMVMTRHGINLFTNLFDHEDLLYYSESQSDLAELNLEDILYEKSLVIVSQPLQDPASEVVGSLFYDSLLAKILSLGPNLESKNGKPREKIIAVLDETHRLPIGRLGQSGDFLREYNLGLVEITPTIVDTARFERNKHVYQTLISLSPGVPEVVELMKSRLPNFFLKRGLNITTNAKGRSKAELNIDPNYQYSLSQDNPGASARSLSMTGRFTGLLQSLDLDGKRQVFWIDFEDELLKHIKELLAEATSPN
ncbi:MAG: hypothetical protein AAFO95_10645, partial [Cyanobacteria bacterium J06600_6]